MTVSPSDLDARFDRIVERWFRQRLRLQPELATFLGIHDYDHLLSSASHDAVEEEVQLLRDAIVEMERLPAGDLSAERSLDRDLVLHESRLRLFQLTERKAWAARSDAAETLGEALFLLFARDFAPLPERLESIASRMEAAPAMFADARRRVTDPVRLWAEFELEGDAALPAFLDTILAAARSERAPATLVERLARAANGVRDALDTHDRWLRDDVIPHAEGEWHAGPERFEELVRLRELEASGDEILAIGEEMLAESHAERDAICAEIDPTLSPAEVGDAVKDDHPATFPEALEEYRSAMDRARRFVVDHNLATMPDQDTLIVTETPSFLRHMIPFAAYYEPAKFDAVPVGTYIVTPPATPEMMREHNYSSISNTSVHEAYPGHHLQLAAASSNPSLVRLLSTAPEFAEGWAFYTERMMKKHGFDNTPRHRYAQLTDVIWRATRIILDVQLHRGQIGFEEAVDRLVAETGFERPAALAEVKRYTSTPTYQLSYLYGRHMIERLKHDVERRMGPAFSLKFFHDTLIYGGTMPVSHARRLFEIKLQPDARDR